MLTRNHLLGGGAALLALALVRTAAAQAPIKIGEINSYKALPAFLEPYKKGWELARRGGQRGGRRARRESSRS